MIKSISFKNYKSFRQKTQLEIKPLTILVGPNNAGKSSITNLLALFKQSTSGNYQPNSFFVLNDKEGVKGPLNRIINYKSMIEGVESKPMEIEIDLHIDCKDQKIEEDKNIIISREKSYELDYRHWNNLRTVHPEFGPFPENPEDLKNDKFAGDKTLQSRLSEIFNFIELSENINSSLKFEIEPISPREFKQKIKFSKGPLDGFDVEMHHLDYKDSVKGGMPVQQNLVNINNSKKYEKKLSTLNNELMKDIFSSFVRQPKIRSITKKPYRKFSSSFIKRIKSIEKEINEHSFVGKSSTGDGLLNYNLDFWLQDDFRYDVGERPQYSDDGSRVPFIEIPEWLIGSVYSNRKNKDDSPYEYQWFSLECERPWARDKDKPLKQKYNHPHRKIVEIYLASLFSLRAMIDLICSRYEKLTSDEERIILDSIRNFLLFSQINAIQVVSENITSRIVNIYRHYTDKYFNAVNIVDIRAGSPATSYSKQGLQKFIGEPVFLFTDDLELHSISIGGALSSSADVNKDNLLIAVNNDLQSIGLKFHLKIESFGPASSIDIDNRFCFLLENHDGQYFGLHEVGYGLSQLIPLLIRKNYFSMLKKNGSTTIIREPEANIHPSLQSKLASNIVSTIKNDSYLSNVIVETHSEHFIRGVQIAVAKGDIKNSDVNILYVNQNRYGNSKIEKIELEEKGRFKSDYPKGFFESGFKEVMELAKLQN